MDAFHSLDTPPTESGVPSRRGSPDLKFQCSLLFPWVFVDGTSDVAGEVWGQIVRKVVQRSSGINRSPHAGKNGLGRAVENVDLNILFNNVLF